MALRLKFTLNPHTGREDLRFNGEHQGVWIEPKGLGYLIRLCEPPDLYPYSWGKFYIRRELSCKDIPEVAKAISNTGDDLLLAMATLIGLGLLEDDGEETDDE
jgi:hypothetical protein